MKFVHVAGRCGVHRIIHEILEFQTDRTKEKRNEKKNTQQDFISHRDNRVNNPIEKPLVTQIFAVRIVQSSQ